MGLAGIGYQAAAQMLLKRGLPRVGLAQMKTDNACRHV
jgi:hypothetical protein